MTFRNVRRALRLVVPTAVILTVLLPAVPRTAAAQVHVGKDSATRLLRLGRDLMYGTAEGLAFAGYDQLTNDPPEWGKGWRGYGKRAASNLGEFYIQESATEGLAALMDRPLDYTRCPCHETHSRIAWALHGIYADEMPNGTHPLAVPRIVGAYLGSFAQASWRPAHGNSRARVALLNGTTSLAIGGLINLYHEFVR